MIKMEKIITVDLSKFGYREIDLAVELLKAYGEQALNLDIGDGLTLNFNSSSGYVFLSDNDCNTYMMNGSNLEQWFYCDCGHEGFKEDMEHEPKDKECLEYLKGINIISEEEYFKQIYDTKNNDKKI